MEIVLARSTVNGSTVQLKAFRTFILYNAKWQMLVHVVATTQDAVKERLEMRMRQNRLEDGRIGLSPLQDAPQVFATRSRAINQRTATCCSVAERPVAAFHHEVLSRVNRRIRRGDCRLLAARTRE